MKLPLRRSAPTAAPAVEGDHVEQVAKRRAAATRLVTSSAAARRIDTAPPGYLLAQSSSDIARHCELLEPLPSSAAVRVIATPGRSAMTWHLDIVSRDRPGLLAVFTGVLVQAGVDVVQAVLATWDDGAALQALTIRAAVAPDRAWLEEALVWALDQGLSAPPVADARVTFDQAASSVYTACEVIATDRPGLLHAVAVAIANAGADIHAASVRTVDAVAYDRFDLTDPVGRKLARSVERSIAANLRDGFSGRLASRDRATTDRGRVRPAPRVDALRHDAAIVPLRRSASEASRDN